MSAEGKERSLIVRKVNAKMPAHVRGMIYLHMEKGADISTIEL